MKLATNNSAALVSGAASEQSTFSITASREAFAILSSGLYTNKIRAVIRELSCNAYDAHVAAGKADIPFYVHMPTSFESFFTVKDEGTGLRYTPRGCMPCEGMGHTWEDETVTRTDKDGAKTTEVVPVAFSCNVCKGTGAYDAVLDLYCTYFGTNKSQSNDFIGALGLGSKSPFSYTEGFSITNVYEGVTRIYAAFKDKGLPTVVLQQERETPDAPNGVEVSFPVRVKDIWEFENQASKVWEFFSPAPETNFPVAIEKQDYLIRCDRWAIKRERHNKIRAIQGFVQYDMGEIDESKMTQDQKTMSRLSLDLFFPLGELSVAASRESLSNDETTIQNILAFLDTVRLEMLDDIKAQLDACTSFWDAKLLYHNLALKSNLGSILDSALLKGKFDGTYILSSYNDSISYNQLDYPDIEVQRFVKTGSGASMYATKNRHTRTVKGEIKNPDHYKVSFKIDKDALFVINDVGYGIDKFVHKMVQDTYSGQQGHTAYMFTRVSKDVEWKVVPAQAESILASMSNPPVVYVSELKARYEEDFKKEYTPYVAKTVFEYCHAQTDSWFSNWEEAEEKSLPVGTKYYLPMKNRIPTVGPWSSPYSLNDVWKSLSDSGLFALEAKTLYGIPEWRVKQGLDSSWVDFYTHINCEIQKVITPQMVAKLAAHKSYTNCYVGSSLAAVLRAIVEDKWLPSESPLMEFGMEWVGSKRDVQEMTKLENLFSTARSKFGMTINVKPRDLQGWWNQVKDAYPLLRAMDGDDDPTFLVPFCEYINMVDEKRENRGATFASFIPQPEEEGVLYVN